MTRPLATLLLMLSLSASCLAPTEIQLTVRTNLVCNDAAVWKGVSIYTGGAGLELESRAPTLTTLACGADGVIGSLVIVPSGDNDVEVGIRVVAGIVHPPEDCASKGYQGCVVSRRAIRFSPHQTLALQVDLTSDCVGLACDENRTCTNGVCQDRAAPTNNNGGSSADAGTEPTVRCGDNNVRCPRSGEVCCLTVDQAAGTTTGDCRNAIDCPPTSIVLHCNDESDCSGRDEAGLPHVCCLSYTALVNKETPTSVAGSSCLTYAQCTNNGYQGLELCQHRQGCLDRTRKCEAANATLPGYFYCVLVDP